LVSGLLVGSVECAGVGIAHDVRYRVSACCCLGLQYLRCKLVAKLMPELLNVRLAVQHVRYLYSRLCAIVLNMRLTVQ
jgi:hypothetical protein